MKFQAHYLKGRVPRLLLKRGRPAALTGANSFYQKKNPTLSDSSRFQKGDGGKLDFSERV